MTLPQALQYLGTAVFAVSAVLAAGRKGLDLLGVLVIALITATGGGTVRDLLLDRTPFWFTDTGYVVTILLSGCATVVLLRWRHPSERVLQIADALGLALFSISGARIAEAAGLPGLIVVVLATITGTFGGVLRDVMCNDIPLLLRPGTIYGTAVIAGATLYVLLQSVGVPRDTAAYAGMVVIAGLRLAAIARNISLPALTIRDTDAD
ncbi:Uncharacterized membrane protein YeiH [Hydrocarboniphaga daqingensis]|uniref:Uncharacterized membrane protein YeiH n=1 Tax=Hydrocarboniphaga daqingensis TaxID=490188 RepID=A0A1M5LKS4_9GAMM|nr:trimeric intracellular cation channel family protein [Hydrocarboniphaga daqingensis]SHG65289.1 Uncharacterized membrane protein YeiH [Hydrocarboniphaga daqingensis]